MHKESLQNSTVCIVGLGYVGLPLAEAFAQHVRTIGFEIDERKIASIKKSGSSVIATADPAEIHNADLVMICVPTPVTRTKEPDLSFVCSAASIVGKNLKRDAIVVLESTVYPGVTEEIVAPILENESGLVCGRDFFVGYSPERINPGDDAHVISRITKIVAGMNPETTERLAALYGLVTTVYRAPDIRTAEAAKVIENVQRDLNIALMNELSVIFHKMGISTREVLAAAGTKWNFHPYTPGIVGGHCIPVDPYYLVYKARELDYHPQVILAGRAINDFMPKYIAGIAIKSLNATGRVIRGSKVLILGLTYKENVPDTRESPVSDIIHELKEFGIQVYGYDPLLSPAEIARFGATPLETLDIAADGIILAAPHEQFRKMRLSDLAAITTDDAVLVDIKGVFADEPRIVEAFRYTCL
jgi:UDP-N-acetyl-D-glucosamine/UDP-N-acetyl-D-galactosamine dehydrogenase